MKSVEILGKWETNPFANPAKAHDGGGYSQPVIKGRHGKLTWQLLDSSCGDFGRRVTLAVRDPRYSSLHLVRHDEISRPPQHIGSSGIPGYIKRAMQEIGNTLGYGDIIAKALQG